MDLDELIVRAYEIGLELLKEWKLSFKAEELSEIFYYHYGSPIPYKRHGFDSLDGLLVNSDYFERCPQTNDIRCVRKEIYEYRYQFPPPKGCYAVDPESEDKELFEVIDKSYAIGLHLHKNEKKTFFTPKEISKIYRSIYGKPIPHRKFGFRTLEEIFEENEHRFVFCDETNGFMCRPIEAPRSVIEETKAKEAVVTQATVIKEPTVLPDDSDEEIRALRMAANEREKRMRVSDPGPPRFFVGNVRKMSLSPEPRRMRRSCSRSPMRGRRRRSRSRGGRITDTSRSSSPRRGRRSSPSPKRRRRSRRSPSQTDSSPRRSCSRTPRKNRSTRSTSRGRITDTSRSSSQETKSRTKSPSSSPKMWRNRSTSPSKSQEESIHEQIEQSIPKARSSVSEIANAAAKSLYELRITPLVNKIVACLEKTVLSIHLSDLMTRFQRIFRENFHDLCKKTFGERADIYSSLALASEGKFSLTKDEYGRWFFAKIDLDKPDVVEEEQVVAQLDQIVNAQRCRSPSILTKQEGPAKTEIPMPQQSCEDLNTRPQKPANSLTAWDALLSRARSRASLLKSEKTPSDVTADHTSVCDTSPIGNPPVPKKQNSAPLPFLPHPSMNLSRDESSVFRPSISTPQNSALLQNTCPQPFLPPNSVFFHQNEQSTIEPSTPQNQLKAPYNDPLPSTALFTLEAPTTLDPWCFGQDADPLEPNPSAPAVESTTPQKVSLEKIEQLHAPAVRSTIEPATPQESCLTQNTDALEPNPSAPPVESTTPQKESCLEQNMNPSQPPILPTIDFTTPQELCLTQNAQNTNPLLPSASILPASESATPRESCLAQNTKSLQPLAPATPSTIESATPQESCLVHNTDPLHPLPTTAESTTLQDSSVEQNTDPILPLQTEILQAPGATMPTESLLAQNTNPPQPSAPILPATGSSTPQESSLAQNTITPPGYPSRNPLLPHPATASPNLFSRPGFFSGIAAAPPSGSRWLSRAASERSRPGGRPHYLHDPRLHDLTIRVRHVISNLGGHGLLPQVEEAYFQSYGRHLQDEFFSVVPFNTPPYILAEVSCGEIVITQTPEGGIYFRLKNY